MAAPAHRLNLKKHRVPHERLTKSADRSGVGRAKQEWAKAQDRFTLTPNVLLIEAQYVFSPPSRRSTPRFAPAFRRRDADLKTLCILSRIAVRSENGPLRNWREKAD
jgi:hypothetical protein